MNISLQRRSNFAACVLALLIVGPSALSASSFIDSAQPAQAFSQIDTLGLPPGPALQLKEALEAHDYITAEKSLLEEVNRDPHSPQAARLLQFLGGVYFLDHDAWHAAIAWNKAKAIAPLPPMINFSLAMAYIRLGHVDWARKVLEDLQTKDGQNALYPYWLGRLDYDADHYDHAIREFQKAIQLAPDMAQAYDNLGLCYYRQNQNQLAIANYHKAIDLDQKSGHSDAWPYLNLAVTERSLNRRSEAEAHLREAIRLDPGLAIAHFQLGNVLQDAGQTKEAISEFQAAAHLDADYAEPHYALARLYRKIGDSADSKREIEIYLRIHSHSQPRALTSPESSQP